jgi:hypothetical protein
MEARLEITHSLRHIPSHQIQLCRPPAWQTENTRLVQGSGTIGPFVIAREIIVQARLAEVRQLLDNDALANHAGVMVNRGEVVTGYQQWSATYDEPRNSLFDCDEPIVHEILDFIRDGGDRAICTPREIAGAA